MKISYNHIIKQLKTNPSVKEISKRLFQLGHEHEIEENIFDIEITPNRGDCLSVKGILRDLSVFYDVRLNYPEYDKKIIELPLDFTNNAHSACPNICFLKIEIENDIIPYDDDLEAYFKDLKINKNNFFTDISNYISYETGQPTHCYDLSKLGNKLSLDFIDGEYSFQSLLNKQIKLSGRNLVFHKGKEIINIAGIMGGNSTSCSKNTRSVIIECAYFNPEEIIGKSIKYDINSEAAYKFERGVDPISQEKVLRRFISIVSSYSKIKNIELYQKNYNEHESLLIPYNPDAVNKIIGINLKSDQYNEYLSKLGFIKKDDFIVVPSHRSDIRTQNDLAEEIARVIGYDNIPVSKLYIQKTNINKELEIEENLKFFLIDNGFFEVINNPFQSRIHESSLKIDNPLDSNKSYIRSNLKSSLIANLLYNERRQKDSIKFFELSDVYFSKDPIEKKKVLGVIASGRIGNNYDNFNNIIDIKYFSDLFNKILPQEDSVIELISREDLDTKIKSPIVYFEVDFDLIKEKVIEYKRLSPILENYIKYKKISEFPMILRDLSFSVTSHKSAKELEQLIYEYENKYLKSIFIFDFYENTKLNIIKIGYRFSFQSHTRTLLEADVNDIIIDIVTKSKSIQGTEVPGF